MKLERRDVRAEVRTSEADPGTFEAVVMNYGRIDTYNTIFDPGCFRDSLEERLPRITWGHDWKDPIGQYVDYKDTDESLTLIGQLDLELIAGGIPAVPRAHQAYSQLKSGTMDQFSVGFSRKDGGVRRDDDQREHFTRAGLEESAIVLSGSVPATHLVSVRSMATDLTAAFAQRVAAGTLDPTAARSALTVITRAPMVTTPMMPMPGADPDSDPVALTQALDAVLDECQDACGGGDMGSCSALLTGAETIVDAILALYGAPDTDEMDGALAEADQALNG